MNQVLISRKTPELVFHTESNPFGDDRDRHQEASTVFKTITGSAARFSQFVGFLCTGRQTYICLPKVFNDHLPTDTEPSERHGWLRRSHLLRKTLLTYRNAKVDQKSVTLYSSYMPDRSKCESQPISHLALAQTILDDFLQHGLWRDQTHIYRNGGFGVTEWPRTIARGGELWVNGGHDPIYPSPMVKQRKSSYDHPLAMAQAAVLHDLKILYGPILFEGELSIPPIALGLSHHQSLPLLGKRLRRSLRELNEQRARRLADLLIKYIELDDQGREDQIDVFGTTSFEVVFEYMCAEVFGAESDLLDQKHRGKVEWRFEQKLASKIGQTVREGRSQRPDLLIRSQAIEPTFDTKYVLYALKAKEGDTLMILDAKYYDIIGALCQTSGQSASYLPGLEDIRKQYAYADWIKRHLGKEDEEGKLPKFKPKKVINGLLFPTFGLEATLNRSTDDLPFEILGEVSLGGDQSISVFGVNLDWLMRVYGSGGRSLRAELLDC
jgi:hypothetical protein